MVLSGFEIRGSEDLFVSSRVATRVRTAVSSEASAWLLVELEELVLPDREMLDVSPCDGFDLGVSAQPRAKLTVPVATFVQSR